MKRICFSYVLVVTPEIRIEIPDLLGNGSSLIAKSHIYLKVVVHKFFMGSLGETTLRSFVTLGINRELVFEPAFLIWHEA
jgi:hypothetical protein